MTASAYDHTLVQLPMRKRVSKITYPFLALVMIGVAYFAAAVFDLGVPKGWLGFFMSFGLVTLGGLGYGHARYSRLPVGIQHDGTTFENIKQRGWVAILLAIGLTTFYAALYFYPHWIEGGTRLADPLAAAMGNGTADHWFLYSFCYCLAVSVMGIRMIYRYRHNRYHIIRTISVIFFQVVIAFLLPKYLKAMGQPEFYFNYFWPLKAEYLFPSGIDYLLQSGGIGQFFVFWAVMMALVAMPLLTYAVGKRWYCSWVCGCGALAETAGDPFRHLSDKSVAAWRFERWSIHLTLVFTVGVTVLLWANSYWEGALLGELSVGASKIHGFVVVALMSGLVGTGFYPVFGSRVWCRFFCPQAALLGIVQRFFSRFRITTNGGQCMSCGNCSTYCEMGIDVRSYAQRGENIVRASCVGCGVCAAVCPRGVLKLENGEVGDRFDKADKPVLSLLDSLKS